MKIKFGEYEIEIKAKYTGFENNKYNKYDTMSVLNKISIYASESSKFNETLGLFAISEESKQISDDIYNELKKRGLYKNV